VFSLHGNNVGLIPVRSTHKTQNLVRQRAIGSPRKGRRTA
jgi:hypothetical protein